MSLECTWCCASSRISQMPASGSRQRCATRSANPAHGPPHLGGEAVAGPGDEPRGVDDPAVPIELMLVGGAVADPDGLAVCVARPSVERAFGTRMLAVQGEQHREARAVEAARVQKPGEEHLGFVFLAAAEKRADPDARVARPREAVVPVANAAEHFRQRSGRGRDGCARRGVGEQPQCEQASYDCVTKRNVGVDRVRSMLANAVRRPRARPRPHSARRE